MPAASWTPRPSAAIRPLASVMLAIFFFGTNSPTPAQDTPAAPSFAQIESICNAAIAEKKFPGCVVVVGTSAGIQYQQAFGNRRLLPEPEPMTLDTLFDMASLTKPIATATSVMRLIDQGKVELDAPVAKSIPEFGANGKAAITVRQLLTHQGGLIADNSIKDYAGSRDESIAHVFALSTVVPPGAKFIYSDVGFIVLGELVARVSGQPLDVYAREHVFQPLGMTETGFRPEESLHARCAPTEQRAGRWMRGEVHDPRAIRMDGVAGHAGLFSTGADVARYAQAMLSAQSAKPVLSGTAWKLMTTPNEVPTQRPDAPIARRGLGWDMRSAYSKNRPITFSEKAFGHSGFTGTSLWIDPEQDQFVVFLSNRVHPVGKGLSNPTASQVGDAAAGSLAH
ncbi:serine hydrolase domain-containing protein [Planctellipticum variicoloris]|uniref:serine hydrolase domain-containing protein n=1 Tax=Planctellipticum variicoloris TaxID=3064265 RepID=UPI0030140231|nr:beta-lactamase family protein [Planctomycetaceae bacterium SH412]